LVSDPSFRIEKEDAVGAKVEAREEDEEDLE
jgi:hypothetical protein